MAVINKRNHFIDLLRFLAAAGVVLFHNNFHKKANWYELICEQLWLGVPVFFVISGYCILIAAKHAKSPKAFITRRFFRIFPGYWFSLLLVIMAVLFSLVVYRQNSFVVLPKDLKSIAATLTLLTWPFTTIRVMIWVYWTLTFEIFFYAVIYLVLFLPKHLRFAALVFVSVCSLVFPAYVHGPLFFLSNWPLFGAGVAVYYLLHSGKRVCWPGFFLVAINLIALFLRTNDWTYAAVGCITALLIFISHFKPIKPNLFSRLGDYSYSIYLIHFPVIFILGYFRNLLHAENMMLNILLDLCVLMITIFISKFVYRFIELPGMIYGKKIAG